ncbi:glycosyltransferase, partial [Candidatus Uhrbacteria bacterium]|nr:glycosyltransferase [Candidatus Uhrbacteria bacterium]
MKTIAIDASRAAEAQKTGVGWYCHHLLANLKDVIPHDQRVILYSDQSLPEELRPWPANWEERVLKRYGPLWSQLVLANAVLRDQPDALFVPAHVIPFGLTLTPRRRRPKLITTIHDVVFKQSPESYSVRERWYADHATRLAARHADRIIVPTHAVARDLERYYGCNQERIAVIHHGVSTSVISAPEAHPPLAETVQVNGVEKSPSVLPGDLSASLRSARDDEKVILYVGRLESKKNFARMIESFSI